MITVIDGVYDETGDTLIEGMTNNFQKDMISWAGDLQTFIADDIGDNSSFLEYCLKYNEQVNMPIDFSSIIGKTDSRLSNSDLIADIDGFNIGKILDQGILLSQAIETYYNLINDDNGQANNRYQKFIQNVTMETTFDTSDLSTNEKFYSEVYFSMGLKFDSNGNLINTIDIVNHFYLFKGTNIQPVEFRKFGADLFIEYISYMASQPLDKEELNLESNIKSYIWENQTLIYYFEITGYYEIQFHNLNLGVELEILDSNNTSVPKNNDIAYYNLKKGDYKLKIKNISFEKKTLDIRYDILPTKECNFDLDFLDSIIGNICENQTFFYKLEIVNYYEITFYNISLVLEFDILSSDNKVVPKRNNNYSYTLIPGIYKIKINNKNSFSTLLNIDYSVFNYSPIEICKSFEFIDLSEGFFFEKNFYIFKQSQNSMIQIVLKFKNNGILSRIHDNLKVYDYYGNFIDGIDYKSFETYGVVSYILTMYLSKNTQIYLAFDKLNDFSETYFKIEDVEEIYLNDNKEFKNTSHLIAGDLLKFWKVKNSGKYEFEFFCNETVGSLGNIKIYKKVNNSVDYIIYRDLKASFSYETTLIKDDEVWLGVENGDCMGSVTVTIKHLENINLNLLCDPTFSESGTEVKLNNGFLDDTIITKGFSRILYLPYNAPSLSRLNYIWESTNENVLSVTSYGTVIGVGIGNANVICINKEDFTISGTINFTIIPDSKYDYVFLPYGMDVRISGTISGTEVTSNLGNKIAVKQFSYEEYITIHLWKTRLICLGNEAPNSHIQSFIWTVERIPHESGNVTVSEFGTITAVSQGSVIVKGSYKYNSRFKVEIFISVII